MSATKCEQPCAAIAYPIPCFLYRYPNANPSPLLNKKHLRINNGVNIVAIAVVGRCPAAKSSADKTFAIISIATGMSSLFLQNTL